MRNDRFGHEYCILQEPTWKLFLHTQFAYIACIIFHDECVIVIDQ